jgi:hypothetical protein
MKRKKKVNGIFENRQWSSFELRKADVTEGQIIRNDVAKSCPIPI